MRQNTRPAGFPHHDDVTVSFTTNSAPRAPEGVTVCLPGAALAPAPSAAVTGLVAKIDEAPVFVDDSGGRKRLLRITGVLLGLLSIGFLAVVGVALAVPTVATSVGLGDVVPFVVPGAAAPPPPKAPVAPPAPTVKVRPQVVAPKPQPKEEPADEPQDEPKLKHHSAPVSQAPVSQAPSSDDETSHTGHGDGHTDGHGHTNGHDDGHTQPKGQSKGEVTTKGDDVRDAPIIVADPPVADGGAVVGKTDAPVDQAQS